MDSFPVKQALEKGVWKGLLFKDVAEMKIKEEEHVLKEKMESIGNLAASPMILTISSQVFSVMHPS